MKPFACAVCKDSFYLPQELSDHINNIHLSFFLQNSLDSDELNSEISPKAKHTNEVKFDEKTVKSSGEHNSFKESAGNLLKKKSEVKIKKKSKVLENQFDKKERINLDSKDENLKTSQKHETEKRKSISDKKNDEISDMEIITSEVNEKSPDTKNNQAFFKDQNIKNSEIGQVQISKPKHEINDQVDILNKEIKTSKNSKENDNDKVVRSSFGESSTNEIKSNGTSKVEIQETDSDDDIQILKVYEKPSKVPRKRKIARKTLLKIDQSNSESDSENDEFVRKEKVNEIYISKSLAAKRKKIKQIPCKICKRKFQSYKEQKIHRFVHVYEKKTEKTAKRCKFEEKEISVQHSKNNDENTNVSDDSTSIVDTHWKINKSNVEKPYECELCQHIASKLKIMRKHIKTFHKVKETHLKKKSKCDSCGIMVANLNKHTLKWHPSERYNVYSKRYGEKDKIEIHQKIRPFACEQCGASFIRRDHMAQHTRIAHTGERPYQCAYCPKNFSRRDLMRKHERIHTDTRPYACQFCHKAFTQRDKMVVHTRLHTGERPYVCDICGKGFCESGNLKKHMRVHGKEPPSICHQNNKGKPAPNTVHNVSIFCNKY